LAASFYQVKPAMSLVGTSRNFFWNARLGRDRGTADIDPAALIKLDFLSTRLNTRGKVSPLGPIGVELQSDSIQFG